MFIFNSNVELLLIAAMLFIYSISMLDLVIVSSILVVTTLDTPIVYTLSCYINVFIIIILPLILS